MNNPFETIDARLSNIENLLLDLKHSNNEHQPESNQLLTIKQASELISLSVPTIYGLVSRNEIPVSKKGKRLYFSKQDLTNWIQEGRKKTRAEIADEVNTQLGNHSKKG
jgi:excisionase family DNA binding protein